MTNPWVQTLTGKAFDLIKPTPDMVEPLDIALSLARKPRYSGFARKTITVGQHCIMGAAAVYRMDRDEPALVPLLDPRRRAQLFALHDAGEAYIGDMLGPFRVAVTRAMRQHYTEPPNDVFDPIAVIENRALRVIFQRFGLDYASVTADEWKFTKTADVRQLLFEKQWFVQTPEPKPWFGVGYEAPPPFTIADYGGGLADLKSLERAAIVTESWNEMDTAGAYLLTLEKLGLCTVDGKIGERAHHIVECLFG